MCVQINQRAYDVEVDSRTSLLDLLREHLAFTGTKKTFGLNPRRVGFECCGS